MTKQLVIKLTDLLAKASNIESKLAKTIETARKVVENGGTTGDQILDLYVQLFYHFNLDGLNGAWALEKAINGSVGSLVLINDDDIFPQKRELKLGVLTSPLEIDALNKKVYFPADKHVRKIQHGRGWRLEDGPMVYDGKQFAIMAEFSGDCYQFSSKPRLYLRDDAARFFAREDSFDSTCADAMNLLGLEAPEIFREKYAAEVAAVVKELKALKDIETMRSGFFCSEEARLGKVLHEAARLGMFRPDYKLAQDVGFNIPKYLNNLEGSYDALRNENL